MGEVNYTEWLRSKNEIAYHAIATRLEAQQDRISELEQKLIKIKNYCSKEFHADHLWSEIIMQIINGREFKDKLDID